jgi:DNA-binding beta-propeller fold protein YncE
MRTATEALRRPLHKALLRASVSLWLISCGGGNPEAGIEIIGGPGSTPGKFALPRAAARDAAGRIFVVDKSGRVQRFSAAGQVEKVWRTPAVEKGRPAGVACDPRGTVLVADTHYHRVLRYTPDGELLAEFGSEGDGPGQFMYPTGLAVAADGTTYVSEFGGNDRVQVFGPDGKVLRAWGKYGEADGEFKRPQGLALAGDLLYVADAANHRIQVFSAEGRFIRSWGGVKYPYSVSVDGEGGVLVAEYGSHRVSKFAPDGRPLGSAGGAGNAPGQLNTPWSVVAAGAKIVVVDSENHRLQLWPSSRLGGPR